MPHAVKIQNPAGSVFWTHDLTDRLFHAGFRVIHVSEKPHHQITEEKEIIEQCDLNPDPEPGTSKKFYQNVWNWKKQQILLRR